MNDVQAHIQRAAGALAAPLPPEVLAEMTTIALPAFMLERTTDPSEAVVRFGGSPRVPEGFAWPARINDPADRRVFPGVRAGQPLSFLADIDLARLVELHGDPPGARLHGRLLVFIDYSDEGRGLEYGPDAMRAPHEQLFACDRDDVRFVHLPTEPHAWRLRRPPRPTHGRGRTLPPFPRHRCRPRAMEACPTTPPAATSPARSTPTPITTSPTR